MLAILDDTDPRVVKEAARLCEFRKIPASERKLSDILEGGGSQNPVAIAQSLAGVATTPKSVELALRYLLQGHPPKYPINGVALWFWGILRNPDPSVSGPARRAIHQYALQFEKQRYEQNLVRDLAETADSDSIAVFEDILANAKDRISRVEAVTTLARLNPETAVERLLDFWSKEKPYAPVIAALRKYAKPSDFDRIAQVFRAQNRPGYIDLAKLMLIELGDAGRGFVKEHLAQFDSSARMWAQWNLEGVDTLTVLNEMQSAGVIRSSSDGLIEKLKAEIAKNEYALPFDSSDPGGLIKALALEGTLVQFDAERGFIPCDHDRLIAKLAKASGGRFKPQWPVQVWHRRDEEDHDAPYTVQFVYRDRLYRVGAENHGDWYDVEAVVRLLNFALETAGHSERFIGLETGGQTAALVFADATAFVPLAKKYGLALAVDVSKAMREGKDTERRVLAAGEASE